MRRTSLSLCRGALIAALYVVLTLLCSSLGLSGSGPVQIRISEALCVLPFFMPEAVAGLTVGCLIANVATAALWQDVVFGTLATLVGALGSLWLSRLPWGKILWTVLPPILANTLIIPPVLKYAYHLEEGYLLLTLFLAVGEIISVAGFGIPLLLVLQKRKHDLFDGRRDFGKN